MNPDKRFTEQNIGAGSPQPASTPDRPQIKIDKTIMPRETEGRTIVAEIFTMTLGNETILLEPFKNWTQLDTFKWRARGLLPRTPAGLEIALDHLKVAGVTVSTWDPEACAKLEQACNEWLQMEYQAIESAKQKAEAETSQPAPAEAHDEDIVHFQLETDAAGKPRLRCLEGKDTVSVVALNQQGLNSLIEHGLMRRPRAFKVGALHDWVELDGELFRFKNDPNRARDLENTLNQRYVFTAETDAPLDVAVFPNPASPTGFDIQFPAAPNGVAENRRRHLNDETVDILQDPEKCRVLRKGIIARLSPPDLIFKLKTAEGGECHLASGPDTIVRAIADDGQIKSIDLSQPVSLLNLSARELTAVFNHPAINRRARLVQAAS